MTEPDEPYTPLPARPAATVMLIRDKGEGPAGDIEVFLMRRHRAMEFVGGVIVFPGGGVDDRDRVVPAQPGQDQQPAAQGQLALALAVGQQPIVPHLDEALRQDVLQKATQELHRR